MGAGLNSTTPQIRGEAPTDIEKEIYTLHAQLCKVFSNPTRLQILNVLREGEMSVGTIALKLRLPPGTVSPHLLMMKARRVLSSRGKGNLVFYRLANPKMLKAFDLIREILAEQMRREEILLRQMENDAPH